MYSLTVTSVGTESNFISSAIAVSRITMVHERKTFRIPGASHKAFVYESLVFLLVAYYRFKKERSRNVGLPRLCILATVAPDVRRRLRKPLLF